MSFTLLRFFPLSFLAILFLFPSTFSFAEEAVQTLDKVVVTAGRVPEKPKNVTQSVTVIPREEIAKNQQSDLGALLRNHGLQVHAYPPGGSQSQLAIRGMRTSLMGDDTQSSILILVNGHRAGTDNISLIPLINVERVEVIRGPAAVQYGSSAISGVVNIITRRGDKLAATAEAGLGSWEGTKALAEISGSGYGFDASGGVSWLTQSDSYKTGKGKTYDNTDINYNLVHNLNLGYTFLGEHRLGINYQGVKQDDTGSPGDTTWLTPNERIDRNNASVDFTYEGASKAAGLSWTGRYYTGEYKYNFEPKADWWMKDKNEYQGAQGQMSFSRGIMTLTGGVDWSKSDREENGGFFAEKNKNITQEDIGVFVLAKLSLLEDLIILSGGLRHDNYATEFGGSDKEFNRATPSVGIAVNPLDWLTLRGNYGESFRIPHTMAVIGHKDATYTYIGNAELEPEKAKSWDLGAEVSYKSLNLTLTYFQTNYKDKIIDKALPGGVHQFNNLPGTSKFRGLEFQVGYDVLEYFDLPFTLKPYLTLTHLFKYADPEGKKVLYVSGTDLSYGLNFNHPDWGLDVDLRFVYMGKQKITETDFTNPAYGQSKQISGYTTADLYVSKIIHNWEDVGTLSLKGEVRNIFDQNYATIDYYPMPGRSFYLGLRYDF